MGNFGGEMRWRGTPVTPVTLGPSDDYQDGLKLPIALRENDGGHG
jgi:hypothetical protein